MDVNVFIARINTTAARASRLCILLLLLIVAFHGRAANAQAGFLRCAQTARIQSILDERRHPAVIAGRIFSLETAITPTELQHGLMGRDHLDSGDGMIFVYQYPQVLGFWMANCLIDLDILFLDSRGRIVSMFTMHAEPPRRDDESEARYEARLEHYSSRRPAQYAVEIQAGLIQKMNLKLGDEVRCDFAHLQQLANEQ